MRGVYLHWLSDICVVQSVIMRKWCIMNLDDRVNQLSGKFGWDIQNGPTGFEHFAFSIDHPNNLPFILYFLTFCSDSWLDNGLIRARDVVKALKPILFWKCDMWRDGTRAVGKVSRTRVHPGTGQRERRVIRVAILQIKSHLSMLPLCLPGLGEMTGRNLQTFSCTNVKPGYEAK